MDNKYLKPAVMLVFGSFLAVSVIFILVMFALKGPSFFPDIGKNPTTCSKEQASAAAFSLIKNSPTFSFDGIKDSIRQVKADSPDNGVTWGLFYTFKTAHPGHGDRSDQVLAQVVTEHAAQIILKKCKISSAVCDNTWDLITDSPINSQSQ